MTLFDAVLDALARRLGTRGLCRMAHGANYLRPSLVGGGTYRCALCGAGFASPADAVGLPDNALDVTEQWWAQYEARQRTAPVAQEPKPKPVAKVEQFRRRGAR